MDNNFCCLGKILKVIDTLQKQTNSCEIEDGCNRPFLGTIPTTLEFNTRPITLYTKDGNLFTVAYDTTGDTSSVFRVENVKGCCVKLRVLVPNTTPDVDPNFAYNSTNTFITYDLKCCGAIRCLPDIIIEGI